MIGFKDFYFLFYYVIPLNLQQGKPWLIRLIAISCLSLASKMKNTHLPFSKLQVKLQIHLQLLKIMVLNCNHSCYYTANLTTRVKCRQIRPQFQLRRPQNLYVAAAIPVIDCNLELCLKSLLMEREHVQCGIVV